MKASEKKRKAVRPHEKTDYGRYRFSRREWVQSTALGALIGGFGAWLCYQSFYALPVAAVLAVLVVREKNRQMAEKRRKLLNYHFRDFLSALHTGMLAGSSLENGVRSAAGDLEKLYGREDVLVKELREMIRQMGFQKPVEQLFRDLGKRSRDPDIDSFGEVLTIAKRTGGSMNQVLTSTWRNLTEKIDTAQEIDTVIAARRFEQTMMSFMPAGIILYLRVTFPEFLTKMYGNVTGVILMTGCLLVYIAAFFLGRKMTAIDV